MRILLLSPEEKRLAKRAAEKRYLRTPKGKANLKRKYLKRIEKEKARWAVSWEVRAGRMKPAKEMKCMDCENQASHYHHESYLPEDRLKVIPLCKLCHHKRHGQTTSLLNHSYTLKVWDITNEQ